MLVVMFIGLVLQIVVAQYVEATSLRREIRLLKETRDLNQSTIEQLMVRLHQDSSRSNEKQLAISYWQEIGELVGELVLEHYWPPAAKPAAPSEVKQ